MDEKSEITPLREEGRLSRRRLLQLLDSQMPPAVQVQIERYRSSRIGHHTQPYLPLSLTPDSSKPQPKIWELRTLVPFVENSD